MTGGEYRNNKCMKYQEYRNNKWMTDHAYKKINAWQVVNIETRNACRW